MLRDRTFRNYLLEHLEFLGLRTWPLLALGLRNGASEARLARTVDVLRRVGPVARTG